MDNKVGANALSAQPLTDQVAMVEYDVRSNQESGYGRADMLMRPKKAGKPGVVIELFVL